MPTQIEEQLIGWSFKVLSGEGQIVADDGHPLFNGDGSPKTEPMTLLRFESPEGEVPRRTVLIPLGDEARKIMAEKLTGGIEIAHVLPFEVPRG